MTEGGIGTVSEIFDADQPYDQRGCIAQFEDMDLPDYCERELRIGECHDRREAGFPRPTHSMSCL